MLQRLLSTQNTPQGKIMCLLEINQYRYCDLIWEGITVMSSAMLNLIGVNEKPDTICLLLSSAFFFFFFFCCRYNRMNSDDREYGI